jgi:hypothetical protein
MGRIIKIILSWFLVIAVPVVSLGLACNALVRLPDIYQYTMTETQVLKHFNAGGQEESVAKSISTYMQHRADELQYQYDEEDEMSLLFSRDEQNLMEMLRTRADIWGIVFVGLMILSIVSLIVLTKGEHYEIIRIRIKIAISLFVVMILAIAIVILIPDMWIFASNRIIGGLNEEQLLRLLFSADFFRMYGIASAVGGSVIMGIISYIVLKYIKPKTIFW